MSDQHDNTNPNADPKAPHWQVIIEEDGEAGVFASGLTLQQAQRDAARLNRDYEAAQVRDGKEDRAHFFIDYDETADYDRPSSSGTPDPDPTNPDLPF